MITAIDAANTFVKISKEDNIGLTPMKLQRLIYLLYREFLQQTKTRLFPERFEVWQYGPVIREVHRQFARYRFNVITDYARNSDDSYSTISLKSNPNIHMCFYKVWYAYREYHSAYLSKLVTDQDSAWYKAKHNKQYVLDDETIDNERERFDEN